MAERTHRGISPSWLFLGLMAAGLLDAQVELQPRMGQPLSGLNPTQLALFQAGRELFELDLEAADGLGPVFNRESCGNCHAQPATGGPGSTTVTRFGRAQKGLPFDPLEELGGSLLQESDIGPEDDDCDEIIPGVANVITERLTTSCFGVGLIEAIPDAALLALESNPPPGVSGTVHWVPVLEDPGGDLRAGRFGWKAQLATVLSFSADASLMEMGLTNRILEDDVDPNGTEPPDLAACDTVPDPEDGPDGEGFDFIDRVTHFQRYLAPPPQTPRNGMSGEQVFVDIGCAACHHPSFTTADDPGLEEALRNQTIRPYSDFLLHDMGVLGDGIVQGDATELLMRTPPLWGLRTRTNLLHDGRAGLGPGEDTLPGRVHRAILEHGGTATAARQAYEALSTEEKDALFAFLDTLGRAEFDFDGDNSVDEADFLAFVACFTGPGAFYTPDDGCAIADVDGDGDVDLDDFQLFLQAYDGMNGVGDCNGNGVIDLEDLLLGDSADCNQNLTPDECDIAGGASQDSDGNGIPDECEQDFVRGDCNLDGAQQVSDAIFVIEYLFQGGNPPLCRDACDVNDDGAIDLADPLYELGFLFSGGPEPPAPFPDCGPDGTPADGLDCTQYPPMLCP